MYELIHEKIEVIARFPKNRKIEIVSFTWKGKEHIVNAVHLISKARKGRECVWLFNVSTDTGAFKLRFDTDTLEWYLEELTWDANKA